MDRRIKARTLRGPGIRGKLLLLSLSLLALPWLVLQTRNAMLGFTEAGQERALKLTSKAIALALTNRTDLFDLMANYEDSPDTPPILFAPEITDTLRIDGNVDDWPVLKDQPYSFPTRVELQPDLDDDAKDLSFDLSLATRGAYLYGLIRVNDDRMVRRDNRSLRLDRSDHLRLKITRHDGTVERLVMLPEQAARPTTYRTNASWRYASEGTPVKLRAQWIEHGDYAIIEFRISQTLLGDKNPDLTFIVGDVDDPGARNVLTLTETSSSAPLVRSAPLQNIITGLRDSAAAIWIVNKNRHTLAFTRRDADESGITAPEPDSICIKMALKGSPWLARTVGTHSADIRTSCHPVQAKENILGAIVVREDLEKTLKKEKAALIDLARGTAIAIAISMALFLLYASRLATRIRNLAQEAKQAIDPDGRLRYHELTASEQAGDEIGGLSRSFSEVLGRLAHYTTFLERMPSTLRHEINNPLNKINTSLENLVDTHPGIEKDRYVERIRRGIEQLTGIVKTLTEATSLEQALKRDELISTDLSALSGRYVESWENTSACHFRHSIPEHPVIVMASSARLNQMLDKLLDNAVDFCPQHGDINIGLETKGAYAHLTISNDGPILSEDIKAHLFQPLVSSRSSGSGHHLGLGLHIVALIAEHHNAALTAENREDGKGVIFTITFPIKDTG